MDRPVSKVIALDMLKKYQLMNYNILGIDGFEPIATGYMARLDLILDLSTKPVSQDCAYEEGQRFIEQQDDNILFEIVATKQRV